MGNLRCFGGSIGIRFLTSRMHQNRSGRQNYYRSAGEYSFSSPGLLKQRIKFSPFNDRYLRGNLLRRVGGW